MVMSFKRFKKGDKVEILSNLPPEYTMTRTKPYLGTVTNVDGSYITVKPKYQRWEGEWYPNELKLMHGNNKKVRS